MLHQIFQVSPFFHSHIFPNPDYSTFVNLDVILNSDLIFKTVIVYHWYIRQDFWKIPQQECFSKNMQQACFKRM